MPRFAVLAAMLISLGAGTTYAADTLLYSPMLSAPVGGSLECHVTNVGKKRLPEVQVGMYHHSGGGSTVCSDLSSVRIAANGHTCTLTTTGYGVCEITITGGSYRSVRAVLNVVDSSGATILSVPATK